MGFYTLAMLFGLTALALPPLIHLLNRRRYDTVDWGAMQFLQVSDVTRRRMIFEEILLMLLRIGLLALLVLALAGPFLDSENRLLQGDRVNRDVVLIFDGSGGMSYTGSGKSAQHRAQDWSADFVAQLAPGDTVAVLQARQQPVVVLGQPTTDRQRVTDEIRKLSAPGGACNWPAAIEKARAILKDGKHTQQDIILISNGQRHGWSDQASRDAWAEHTGTLGSEKGGLWAVNIDPHRPAQPPNWSVGRITSGRAVVAGGQEVAFHTFLKVQGAGEFQPPHRLELFVNDQLVKSLETPRDAKLERGQVAVPFKHRFPKEPGTYLVSVRVEPDPEPNARPKDYVPRDYLPYDNHRDFALEIVRALPVLIVDGDVSPKPLQRGADFLRNALAPATDATPVMRVRVVGANDFGPQSLSETDTEERPRVVILANVARLSGAQQSALDHFIQEGGGVLVTLGERCDRAHYNNELYRGGAGWLPAQLDKLEGDDRKLPEAVRPLPASFTHPALELFRGTQSGGLENAYFARWWRVSTPGPGHPHTTAAVFNRAGLPWFVERPYGEGRVLLATVPLDTSWRSNLTDLPAYVPLVHELVGYLASVRVGDHNLQPGQPLRYRLPRGAALTGLTLQSPLGETRPFVVDPRDDRAVYPAHVVQQVQGPVLISEGLREPGVWRLQTPTEVRHFVVQPDAAEADLTPLTVPERQRIHQATGITFVDNPDDLRAQLGTRRTRLNLWWLFLIGLVVLLCGEVFMTRWIVKNR